MLWCHGSLKQTFRLHKQQQQDHQHQVQKAFILMNQPVRSSPGWTPPPKAKMDFDDYTQTPGYYHKVGNMWYVDSENSKKILEKARYHGLHCDDMPVLETDIIEVNESLFKSRR